MSSAAAAGARLWSQIADRTQQYRVGNGDEPSDLDPQTAIGQIEHDIMLSLFEGLVVRRSQGRLAACRAWRNDGTFRPTARIYTFHLRNNARWSNGEPVTARDFLESYHRMLLPSLAAQYSYMLYPVTNAEAFNNGKITNFDEVGFKALDDYTFQLTLHSPTPYLLSMMIHDSWYPGADRDHQKIRRARRPLQSLDAPGDISSATARSCSRNGACTPTSWSNKSQSYWDAAHVRLNTIYFDPEESYDTEERMFRSGQLHTIRQAPQSKVAVLLEDTSRT